MSKIEIPELLELKQDSNGSYRLYIDGEMFPYGTVRGVTVGPISRNEMPNVTLQIVGMRVVCDWSLTPPDKLTKDDE